MRFATPYWLGFVLAVVAMGITAATETAFPAMMKPLLDKGFQPDYEFQIWWAPVFVMLIFLVRGVANFAAGYMMQWIANNILRDIRQAMFDKLLTMPSATFDTHSAGRLISRLISETQYVMIAATNVITVIVRDSLALAGLIGWLLYLNWKLTLIVIILVPPLAAITMKFSRRLRAIGEGHMSAIGDMTSSVEEAISGHRVIKIFDRSGHEKNRFSRINSEYRGQAMRLAIAQALQTPINQLVAALGVAAVLTIWLIQTRSGLATIGDFVSFITAMLMLFGPLRHLSDINAQLQRGLTAARGVFQLLDQVSEPDEGKIHLQKTFSSIRYVNVAVQYPSRSSPAILNINLTIPAGKTYAFVGPSGGGKSTIVNLLPRFYELKSGDIFIDDTNIKEFTLSSLRNQISIVSQDIVLFNDTIGRNIAYGRDRMNNEDIWTALKVADLEEFIASLPQGLDTVVGDRGVRVSGGQRQRIAIARAVMKNAPILIFDEATSALDNNSEAAVQSAVNSLRVGRTTLIVAHRLTTIQNADQIVVVDKGVIVQVGGHDQLVRESGLYSSLYQEISAKEQSERMLDGAS
jgi:subfamily B ATP-binding cassette protein MsbA